MATILVTGGAGYVGSHACKALARAGHTPIVYDSLIRGHRELVKWGPLEVGDIHDKARLAQVMNSYRPVAVLHFASFIFVNESVAQPDLYDHNIVGGTQTLVDAMADADLHTLVVSSSAAVYGTPTHVPIAEDASCRPVNPYGAAKLRMEQLLARAQTEQGLSWVALRYFNAAGADPDGETGEWHEPENHLIPLVLDVARGKGEAITVNGVDYPTRDGTCVRDYIHVMDLADAHLLAWRYAIGNGGGAAFNLGTGRGSSVQEVVTTARKVTGRNISVVVGNRREGDPPALVADPSRAQSVLGWAPRRSDLTTQIEDAWAWQLSLPR
ncbi:MAG: UDP-glucose 4-epimerase GalE [Rhodospirillaceae bacterium]